MTETKKANWEEAIKRLYYVAWIIWAIGGIVWVTRDEDRIASNGVLEAIIWFVLPYFPYIAAKWVYKGYKTSK